MIRLLSAALLLSSAAPALAQTQQAGAPAAPAQQSAPQTADTILGSQLIGAAVNGPGNQSIGKIRDIVIGEGQRIEAVVAGVGGFLGVGEKDVSLPIRSVTITRGGDGVPLVTTAYDKAALTAAPAFDPKTPTLGQRLDRAIDGARQAVAPADGAAQPQGAARAAPGWQQQGYQPNQGQPYGYNYGYAQQPQMGYGGQMYPQQGGYQHWQPPQYQHQQPQYPGNAGYGQGYGYGSPYPSGPYGYGPGQAAQSAPNAGGGGQAQVGGQMGAHAGGAATAGGGGSGNGAVGIGGQATGSVGGQMQGGGAASAR